jgi:hypothetical protein
MNEIICKACGGNWYSTTQGDDYCDPCVIAGEVIMCGDHLVPVKDCGCLL